MSAKACSDLAGSQVIKLQLGIPAPGVTVHITVHRGRLKGFNGNINLIRSIVLPDKNGIIVPAQMLDSGTPGQGSYWQPAGIAGTLTGKIQSLCLMIFDRYGRREPGRFPQ